MSLDRYTLLRQMGFSGSLAEMETKFLQNVSGLDSIGEQLDKALDAAMARQFLEITPGGGGVVAPSDLVPSLGNVDNTSDANKPVSTAQQTALNLKANQTSLDTTNTTVSSLATTVGTKAPQTSLDTTNTNVAANTAAIALKATDTLVTHLAGTETITGVKTFSVSPIIPAPTTTFQPANKGYVDSVNSNTYALFPANSAAARNYVGGGAIPAGTVVFWFTDGTFTPANALATDQIVNTVGA